MRADSDTAIPASILSIGGSEHPPASCIVRDRGVAVWKVATTGTSAAHSASNETLGVIGSWMWTRSNCPPATSGGPGPRSAVRSSPGPPTRCRAPARRARRGEAQVSTSARAVARSQDVGLVALRRAGSGPGRGRGSARRRGASKEYGQTRPTAQPARSLVTEPPRPVFRGSREEAAASCASPPAAGRSVSAKKSATSCVMAAARPDRVAARSWPEGDLHPGPP